MDSPVTHNPAVARATRRFAFVVPRFGRGIVGGCERLVGSLAEELRARGDYVEIFTTCARDNRSWENHYEPGRSEEEGLAITRFPVDPRNLEIWIPLQISISEGWQLSVEDQLRWMEEGVNSRELYAHLAAVGGSFDALFFAPYLFPVTFWGAQIHPDRSWLIPCLHDETQAYLEIMHTLFQSVRGCLFNAAPEQRLAEQLYGNLRGAEVGMGFYPVTLDAHSPYFEEQFPYLLYLGRKETGKNVQLLIDLFTSAKDKCLLPAELRLVIAGGGSFSDLHRDSALTRGDIVDCHGLSEHEKLRIVRHAEMLIQPSTNESFSIVIMEAWQLRTPVVVHAACAVTRDHVVHSGGGLYFRDEVDFVGAVRAVLESSELRAQLGDAGHRYVADRYSWRSVLARFDAALGGESEQVTV